MAQESNEMYDKFGFPETIDRLVCTNATAAILEKQETMYQEYVNCVKNTVDLKQMNMDMRFMIRTIITSLKFSTTITDLQTSSMRLYAQRFVQCFLSTIQGIGLNRLDEFLFQFCKCCAPSYF